MQKQIALCNVCNKNKINVKDKKVGTHFYSICPDCIQELKLTTACLGAGTDWILEKYSTKYAKFSNITVTPLE